VKTVNKRRHNLLNEIQNVFINGKQVKTAKITANNSVISTILRHKNYRQLTALRYYSPHAPTPLHGDNANQWRFQAAANSLAT